MENFTIHKLDLYPISKYYIEQLNMFDVFDQYLPKIKGVPLLSECLCILIQNIVVSPRPMYQIQNWLKSYSDGQGEYGYESSLFTDDRLGEALDKLYSADRQSMMTAVSSNAIAVHHLATDKIHNDTTTITLQGDYATPSEDGVQIARGYNKDHRPDCKQIVFGLNTLGDGHVPISLHLYNGNTSDDQTHQVNWDEIRTFLKTTDFCYIADSKVATKDNMQHIAQNNGTFISILPATRREAKDFKQRLLEDALPVNWQPLAVYPNSRQPAESITYRYFEDTSTAEDFRLLWIHSDAKARIETERRNTRIAQIALDLDHLAGKLNKYKLKTQTQTQIEQAAAKLVNGYAPFFDLTIQEHKTLITKQVGRGKPHANTKYRQLEQVHYTLQYTVLTEEIEKYQRQDGIFPLVTNCDWTAAAVLKTYKEQPYLEKRFSTLKSVLNVAPVFLKSPKRIEAMLLLYFFALMVVALIERQIRNRMAEQQIESLPILPQRMKTKKPTLNNLRYLFRDTVMVVFRSSENEPIAYVKKGFDKIHTQILDLLKVPLDLYQINDPQWWKFKPNLNS